MVRPRQVTNAEILTTARECFLKHGPGVSTAVIAKLLGFSEAALFKRFKTKHDLLREALCVGIEPEWFSMLATSPDDRDPREQLLEIAKAIDTFMERLVPALWMLRASGMDPTAMFERFETPPPVKGKQLLAAWFKKLHDSDRAHVPQPDTVALAFIGALHTSNFFRHVAGDELIGVSREDYVHGVVETFWSGIAPKESS